MKIERPWAVQGAGVSAWDASRGVQGALDVVFGRPCSCPEHHVVSGTCPQKTETATDIGGMCVPCAMAYRNEDWLGNQPLLAASVPANRPGG